MLLGVHWDADFMQFKQFNTASWLTTRFQDNRSKNCFVEGGVLLHEKQRAFEQMLQRVKTSFSRRYSRFDILLYVISDV